MAEQEDGGGGAGLSHGDRGYSEFMCSITPITLVFVACVRRPPDPIAVSGPVVDVVLVPGCPSLALDTSHGGHARGARSFLRGWGTGAVALEKDLDGVVAAKRLGRIRGPSSVWGYSWAAIAGRFAKRRPLVPPTRELTLRGLRYRDDHQPWSDGQMSTSVAP